LDDQSQQALAVFDCELTGGLLDPGAEPVERVGELEVGFGVVEVARFVVEL
jgi:hypothetical protein